MFCPLQLRQFGPVQVFRDLPHPRLDDVRATLASPPVLRCRRGRCDNRKFPAAIVAQR
jgi:hypothetical protein